MTFIGGISHIGSIVYNPFQTWSQLTASTLLDGHTAAEAKFNDLWWRCVNGTSFGGFLRFSSLQKYFTHVTG